MKKTMAAIALAGLAAPTAAMAKDSTGCGLGTMVFDGQSGAAPQVAAVTTNGTFGNQTFGISSGTLGCDRDGTVDHMADVSEFTKDNMDRLAADMAAGEGETLATVGDLIGVDSADQDHFNRVMQDNFDRIYSSTDATAREVVASMQSVMEEDQKLSSYLT
jgi:hypothetical protein